MSWEITLKIVEVALLVANIVVLGVVAWMRGTFASKKELAGVIELAADAHHRLDLQDERIKNLPTSETVRELREDIGELKQGQAVSREKLDGIKDSVSMLRESIQDLDQAMRSK